jgi:hypothetical protein
MVALGVSAWKILVVLALCVESNLQRRKLESFGGVPVWFSMVRRFDISLVVETEGDVSWRKRTWANQALLDLRGGYRWFVHRKALAKCVMW